MRLIDSTRPAMLVTYETEASQSLRFEFGEELANPMDLPDITITNLGTGLAIPLAGFGLSSIEADRVVLLSKPGLAWPDGLYRLDVAAGALRDRAGNLSDALSYTFRVLTGDIDGNGRVDFADLLVVAQNYGSSSRSRAQGNIDYSVDGSVNFADLLILAQTYGVRVTDVMPRLISIDRLFDSAPQRIRLWFSQDVASSIDANDVYLTNTDTGVVYGPSMLTVTAATSEVNVSWPSLGALPTGRYQLRVLGPGIENAAGVPLPTDEVYEFQFLAGDINGDLVVNFNDLLVLAQNYGRTGMIYSSGNVDYSQDGLVGFSDLLILAQNYNQSLLASPAAELAGSPARRGRRGPVADVFE
jgi:Dockerin type I domain